jgi:hypothetical protein
MSKVLFGLFTNSVELFGIIISILLIIIGFIVVIVVRTAVKKVKDLEQFHDDIIAVRLEMEGRKSFSDTIKRHDFEIKDLNRKSGEHFARICRIDDRCERRMEDIMYKGRDRRKASKTSL